VTPASSELIAPATGLPRRCAVDRYDVKTVEKAPRGSGLSTAQPAHDLLDVDRRRPWNFPGRPQTADSPHCRSPAQEIDEHRGVQDVHQPARRESDRR
jgi:hypothetical protein